MVARAALALLACSALWGGAGCGAATPQFYSTRPLPLATTPDIDRWIYPEVSRRHQDILPDERLSRLARAFGKHLARETKPSRCSERLRNLSWSEGLPESSPGVFSYSADADASFLPEKFWEWLEQSYTINQVNRIGIARSPLMYGRELIVVTVVRRSILLEQPLTQNPKQGEPVRIVGSLVAPAQNPELAVTAPSGKVVMRRFSSQERFDHRFVFNESGPFQIEVMATEPVRGHFVAANFPAYVDASPLEPWPSCRDNTVRTGATQFETEMLELVNSDRAKANLPPLAGLEVAARSGRAHAEEMIARRYFGHRSPTTGEPHERLKAAKIPFAWSGENLGSGATAREAHEGLMSSPGHRAAVLSPNATHVGIGAVAREDGIFYVAEEFVGFADPQPKLANVQGLLSAINRMRTQKELPPVSLDPKLLSVAKAVSAVAPEESIHELMTEFSEQLRRAHLRYTKTQAQAATLVHVQDLSKFPLLLRPDLRAIGLASATESKTALPTGAVLILIAYGYGEAPRAPLQR